MQKSDYFTLDLFSKSEDHKNIFFLNVFLQCDATCGEAFKFRSVECIDIADGDVVSMELCEEEAPVSVEACEDLPECPCKFMNMYYPSKVSMLKAS